ncbi:MAG: D-aminoacyl-tRNA deacylase, partial [Ruminococcus sp.]|nr:D-aminoacyl-tRNA deacylase [Ruminococcus sp.]
MRIVLQRVSSADVKVDGKVCGKIDIGFLLLFGVGHDDTEADCRRLGDKIVNLRIFSDENGRINRSLSDVDGGLLIVPQFTLYA